MRLASPNISETKSTMMVTRIFIEIHFASYQCHRRRSVIGLKMDTTRPIQMFRPTQDWTRCPLYKRHKILSNRTINQIIFKKLTDGLGGVFIICHILLGTDDFNFHIRADNAALRFGQVTGSNHLSRFSEFIHKVTIIICQAVIITLIVMIMGSSSAGGQLV